MAVVNLWVGALSHQSARIIGKASPGASQVRLLVSTSPNVSNPTVFGPITPDAEDIVDFTATGLSPGTRYHYGLDEDMTFDSDVDFVGTFRTNTAAPGNPISFTFAAGGCGGGQPAFPGDGDELSPDRVSNHPVYDEIQARGVADDWAMFIHTGDLHYYNIGTDLLATLANYRQAYDDVLDQAFQHALYRNLPLIYMWDDHDFDGNNSDGTYTGKDLAQQVYRERVPSYSLPLTVGPIYHSFEIGRVLFVVTDNRSERSPNGDPDDANKTMLGINQKVWLDSVLAASNAQLLVWINSVPWVQGTGQESWSGYTTEAAELIQIFTDRGFIDRMFTINGDAHFMAMDDGTNTPGRIPVFVTNHLDSGPSGNIHQWSEGPPINNKGQYGTIEIADDGVGDIAITWKGWATGGLLLREHTFTVPFELVEPTPPAPQVPVTPSATKIEPTVTFLVCRIDNQLGSHKVVQEIAGTHANQMSRILGEHTPADLEIPIPDIAGDDLTFVQKAALARTLFMPVTPRVIVVAVLNGAPAWAGLPLKPVGGTAETIRVATPSVESYLTRRFVQGHAFTQRDVGNVIAAGLVADAEAPIQGIGGGLGLVIDAPELGVLRDRRYTATENISVYEALSELMSAGLIEWTIDPEWADDRQNRVVLIVRIRSRIGAAVPTAMFQDAASSVFQAQGGAEATYTHDVDFGSGRFANVVQSYSTGQGDDQPRSQLAVDTAQITAGTPIFEDREQAGNGLDDTQLEEHAQARLDRIRHGSRLWTIQARWDAYPRYGVDWRLGDDISYDLVGHLHPGTPDGGHRAQGTGRAIGVDFNLDEGTVQPILLDPQNIVGQG